MEDEKKLKEMNIDELVDIILENPDRMDEVFKATEDLSELYNALESELFPSSIVFDDAEMNHNVIIESALKTLSENYLYEDLDYEGVEPLITNEDLIAADKELEEFYVAHPEMDSRPNSQIPEGMSEEKFLEAMGASINEFGEIIRPEKIFYIFGHKFTEEQIIEGINEDSFYYYDIINVIRQDKKIRDLVFSKLISLDYYGEEFKGYKTLLDEINNIRMKEIEQDEKSLLQQKEAELSLLETEEKTISGAEALIDKQTEKEGQNIGE